MRRFAGPARGRAGFDNAGEISSIDTELFTACNLVEMSNCDTDEVLGSAYKIICQSLENNLFNVSVSAITDSSNLWWAVKLAVQTDGILKGIPGGAKEPLVKAVNLVNYALLKPLAFPPTSALHPLDYTPEIYGKLRTNCYMLINLLEIQRYFVRSPTFRRSPHLWHVLSGTDLKINECWRHIRDQSPDSLNLYCLATLNKAQVHWLAFCRTDARWTELKNAFGMKPHRGKLNCRNVIRKLCVTKGVEIVSHNESFNAHLISVLDQMRRYLKSGSHRHPSTIALCGPPGSGKTFAAKTLIKRLDEEAKGQPLNLANNWPSAVKPWVESFTDSMCFWSGRYRDKAYYPFQAVVIDEADSQNPLKEQASYAYQWLLAPLWDAWPDLAAKTANVSKTIGIPSLLKIGASATPATADTMTPTGGSAVTIKQEFPTFVFVISSRFETWSAWHTAALSENKGKDFVSRVDAHIDIPLMGPEDQLVVAASLFKADEVRNISAGVAKAIALGRFEHEARSIENLKKQCDLKEAREKDNLVALPHRGLSERVIRLQPSAGDESSN